VPSTAECAGLLTVRVDGPLESLAERLLGVAFKTGTYTLRGGDGTPWRLMPATAPEPHLLRVPGAPEWLQQTPENGPLVVTRRGVAGLDPGRRSVHVVFECSAFAP
jgi:hypothetical protein